MILLWDLYWPVLAAGLVAGVAFGWPALQDEDGDLRRRQSPAAAGAAAAMAAAALWHGPAGTAVSFAATVESDARAELERLDMGAVNVRLERGPMRRSLVLDGPADAFQRRELRRLMDETVGIADARWETQPGGLTLPLIVEAMLASLVAFSFGLLFAYLVVLRRRANASWRW